MSVFDFCSSGFPVAPSLISVVAGYFWCMASGLVLGGFCSMVGRFLRGV